MHMHRALQRICTSIPATRTKVEETGGANFIFITKDGTFVTPKSDSILPSITPFTDGSCREVLRTEG